jgi:hypothetical protein
MFEKGYVVGYMPLVSLDPSPASEELADATVNDLGQRLESRE